MVELTKDSRNRGKRMRSFEHQCRSCRSCGSVDGLEIHGHQKKDDFITCQVCGASYLLQSVQPIKLQLQSSYDEQNDWLRDHY